MLPNISSILSAAFFDMRIVSPVFLNLGNIYPPFVVISLYAVPIRFHGLKIFLYHFVTIHRERQSLPETTHCRFIIGSFLSSKQL